MNKNTLKQLTVLSAIIGGILGVLTLIPFVGQITFLVLMCLTSVIVIWLMLRVELLDISTNRQSVVIGALIGFVSFLAFSLIYLPAVSILGHAFNLYEMYSVSLFLNIGSFGIILLLVIFMGILSATVNAFTGFLTYYCYEFLKGFDKGEINKQPPSTKSPFNGSDESFKL